MQQNEMWLDVLKWMGWTNIRPNTAPHNEYKGLIGTKDGRNLPIPELTLDALHEGEMMLNEVQQTIYLIELDKEAYGGPNQIKALYRICAPKSQRLPALWRTIRNSSTRTTPAAS